MTPLTSKLARFAVAAGLVFVAASCTSDDGSVSDGEATDASSTVPPDTDTPQTTASQSTQDPTSSAEASASSAQPSPGDPIKVVYIPKNLGNPYFDTIVAGLEEAAG